MVNVTEDGYGWQVSSDDNDEPNEVNEVGYNEIIFW